MRSRAIEHRHLQHLGVWALIGAYLGAVVLANLTVALSPPAWRGSVVIVNAFLLIALDLTAGDRLHEVWKERGLLWRFAMLILAGSALSYALNSAAGPVALASCAAFGLSAVSDRLMYGVLGRFGWHVKVNGSNVVSAAVDSVVFLGGLALAGLLPWHAVPVLMLGQWLAKVAGGALWSAVLRRAE
jgi:queuosine precursor transporter